MNRRSLRTTVALIVAITLALTVAGLAVGVWLVTRAAILSSVDASLESRIQAGIFLEGEDPDGPPVVRPPVPDQPTVLVDAVLADGEIIDVDAETFDLPASDLDIEIAEDPPGTGAYSTRIAPDGTQVRVYTVSVVEGAAARAMRNLTETNGLLVGLGAILGVGGVAAVVVGAVAGVIAVRRSTTPLAEVADAMDALARGQQAQPPRATLSAPREVVAVVDATTTLQEALARSQSQQERLVQDAGHELRTPLAALRANVQFAERTATDDATRASLEAAEAELDELGRLVEELLALAARDEQVREVVDVDLCALARSAAARLTRRTGALVRKDLPERVLMTTDPVGLAEVLGNLLDNAAKFGGDPIVVSVRDGDDVVIEVRDGGSGVPTAEREAVFERFYRSPAARSLPGSGLGLSIVRRVVDGAGGSVVLDDAPEGGLAVRVTLPRHGRTGTA